MSYSKSMKAFLMTVLWLLINSPSQAAPEYTEFYHTDASDSIVAASDEQGDIIWQKTHDPYGNEVVVDGQGDEIVAGKVLTNAPKVVNNAVPLKNASGSLDDAANAARTEPFGGGLSVQFASNAHQVRHTDKVGLSGGSVQSAMSRDLSHNGHLIRAGSNTRRH